MTIADVMSRDVLSLRPADSIQKAAHLMQESYTSSLPVMDESGTVIGLVTEKDLLGRLTGRRRCWWQTLAGGVAMHAREYCKRNGITVAEVMSPIVAVATPDLSIEAAADLLTQTGMRELPVVAAGHLMGSVSRTDLLAVLAIAPRPRDVLRTDADLIAEMKTRLGTEDWIPRYGFWIEARNGAISLYGLVDTEEQRAALGVMAHSIDGCVGVESSLVTRSPLPR
jgi:predicted transcriptional regulator